MIVVPGVHGLSSHEKDICRRLARSGLAAVSLDLYSGGTRDLGAYNALEDHMVARDLDELHEFIASDDIDWCVSPQVGLLGTDIGGRFALMKAATKEWARSVGIVYTPLTGDEERDVQVADYLDHLPGPVIGIYGANDDLIDTSTIDEAQSRNDHGQWLIYEGVGHGFLDVGADEFDQAAADDAFARLIAFFTASLEPAVVEDLG